MVEQDKSFKPIPEKEPSQTSILRIVPDERDLETGEVFAEILYNNDIEASNAKELDVVSPLVGYDPQQFPEDIRDKILTGTPFEVTTVEIQSPDDPHIVDTIEVFSLVQD